MKNLTSILFVGVVLILLLTTSVFTVDQTQFIVVKRLGEIVSVKKSLAFILKYLLLKI